MTAFEELFHEIDRVSDATLTGASSGATLDGDSFELTDCDGFAWVYDITVGVVETGAGAFTFEESDDDITFTTVAADQLIGDAVVDLSAAAQVAGWVNYVGYKKYVRASLTTTDAETSNISVHGVKHNLRVAPPSTPTV